MHFVGVLWRQIPNRGLHIHSDGELQFPGVGFNATRGSIFKYIETSFKSTVCEKIYYNVIKQAYNASFQSIIRVGSDYAQVERRSVTFMDQTIYVERRILWNDNVY